MNDAAAPAGGAAGIAATRPPAGANPSVTNASGASMVHDGWAAIESSAHVSAIASSSRSAAGPPARGASGALAPWRTMALGTIVDEGGRVARRHGKTVFIVSSALLIPAAVAEVLVARAVRDRFLDGQNPLGSFRIAFFSAAANDAGSLTAFISLGLAALAALFIGAYVSTIVADERLGRVVSQRTAIAAFLRRVPSLTVAWSITHSWVFLVFWAGQANGGLAAFVAALAIPFAVLSTYLAPVMMLERLGPWAATKRSWSLAKRTFGTTVGFFSLSSLVGLWFRFGLALFPVVIRTIIVTDRYQWLIEGVGAQIGIIISAPIVACATVVMYLDVRTRTEGMDLSLEADRLLARG